MRREENYFQSRGNLSDGEKVSRIGKDIRGISYLVLPEDFKFSGLPEKY